MQDCNNSASTTSQQAADEIRSWKAFREEEKEDGHNWCCN